MIINFIGPFLGTVTVELLNQLGDYKHQKSHNPATNTQYLLDDTLYSRVSVKVYNNKPWLV